MCRDGLCNCSADRAKRFEEVEPNSTKWVFEDLEISHFWYCEKLAKREALVLSQICEKFESIVNLRRCEALKA